MDILVGTAALTAGGQAAVMGAITGASAWPEAVGAAEETIAVTRARWPGEVATMLAEQASGQDDYEVRSFHSRFRHISLAQ